MFHLRSGALLIPPLVVAATQMIARPSAQVVLPAGVSLAATEGNDKQFKLFGCESGQFRFQQVDGDLRNAQTFQGLAFRRDGFDVYDTAFPRAAELQIVMGKGAHMGYSDTFDANFRWPTRTVVCDRTFVSLPDFRTPPVTPPATFLPAIPFTRPFYFDGTEDLVWEIDVYTTTPTRTSYPLDAHKTVPEQLILHNYGVGCIANPTQPVLPMSLASTGITYSDQRLIELCFYVDRAPAMEFPMLLWGLDEQQFPFPGLCTNLYVNPVLATPMPQANAVGTSTYTLRVPYIDAMEGQQVCNQAIAYDANQVYPIKVAGSNGTSVEVKAPMPRVKSISAPTVATTVAPTGIDHGFGIVVRLN
ncbi:MAG: hypothetical protein R3F56_16775 [Planctomycetota bacterium]